MVDVPGSAGLVLVSGVVHLDEEAAVFEAMLTGWGRQQRSRMLGEPTITDRLRLVRRFAAFAEAYPWTWGPGDVEDFTVTLTSGAERRSPSTIRGYHLTLRMFCDYLTDARYEWSKQCRDRFGRVPTQVCHEWNTVAHLTDYEGRPGRRPLTYGEVQQFFDYLDERVEQITRAGRKGSLSALRDAQASRPPMRSGCAATSYADSTWQTCARIRTCGPGAPTDHCTSATARRSGAVSRAGAPCSRSRSSTGPWRGCGSGLSRPARCSLRPTTRRCGSPSG